MKVGVFCSSVFPARSIYLEEVHKLGALLAIEGMSVLYGGGSVGLMGRLAQSVLEAGGEISGIVTDREVSFPNWSAPPAVELSVVESSCVRRQKFFEEADAFVVLPGGFGTLSEVSDLLAEKQADACSKPLVFLNTAGYWDRLVTLLVQMKDDGFIREEDTSLFQVVYTPQAVISFLKN